MENLAIEWQAGLGHPYEKPPPTPYVPRASDQFANGAAQGTGTIDPTKPGPGTPTGNALFGDDGFTFFDLIDIINPLQHIPVISTIYRSITGDQIDPGARVLGGALFGGIPGAAISVANAALKGITGRDLGEHALAAVTEDEHPASAQHAQAPPDISSANLLLAAQAAAAQPPPAPAKPEEPEEPNWFRRPTS